MPGKRTVKNRLDRIKIYCWRSPLVEGSYWRCTDDCYDATGPTPNDALENYKHRVQEAAEEFNVMHKRYGWK